QEERPPGLSGSLFNYPLKPGQVRHVGVNTPKGPSHVKERAGHKLAVMDRGHTIQRRDIKLSVSDTRLHHGLHRSEFTPSGQKPKYGMLTSSVNPRVAHRKRTTGSEEKREG
ncbi:hypothetical protein GE21DRAFT_1341333, partial [Neurospora crassa]